jgi:hypothetical protein
MGIGPSFSLGTGGSRIPWCKKKKKAFKKAIETSVYIKNGKKIKGIFFFIMAVARGNWSSKL